MGTTKELPTVISFCSGYGGIETGIELAGAEHRVIAYVEIEAFAIANLVAKMEAGKLDPAPIWTDLKTFPAHLFRGAVDIITCGQQSGSMLKPSDQIDAFSRMSKDTYRLDSPASSATWKKMVTQQRGEYSQRVKLAHHTKESESISWPTPAARDYKGAVLPETLTAKNRNPMTNSLPDAVQHKSGRGNLNPDWVEWLMGVPIGWTELDF